MKSISMNLLPWAAGLLISAAALADEPAPCGITTHVGTDGAVELSNTDDATVKCDAPASAATNAQNGIAPGASGSAPNPAPGAAASKDSVGSVEPAPSAAANAQPAPSDPPKDPHEQYRDAMLQGAPGTTAANPAVSRRYKMMNKETYKAMVLDPAAQDAQAGSAPSR